MTAACPHCGAPVANPALPIGEVGIVLAPIHHEVDGLLAWVRVRVGPFLLAGLSVRRTLTDEIAVAFPARRDRRGTLHREITTLDPDLDSRIRAAVIAAYLLVRSRQGRVEREGDAS